MTQLWQLGDVTKYTYTPEGWLETATDANGQTTRYSYDRTGTLTAESAPGESRSNSYNKVGLVTSVTTDEGVTEYQYDDRGYLLSVTEPNGSTVSYTYDEHGNHSSIVKQQNKDKNPTPSKPSVSNPATHRLEKKSLTWAGLLLNWNRGKGFTCDCRRIAEPKRYCERC